MFVKWSIVTVLSTLFAAVVYTFLPRLALTPDYLGFWFLMTLAVGLLAAIALPAKTYRQDFVAAGFASIGVWLAVLCLVGLGNVLASSAMLHSARYHALLGKTTVAGDYQDLPVLNLKQAPLVSEQMAKLAAEKRLSERPALGSQFYVGHMTRQLVNGKQAWVGFLEFQGFFAWHSAGCAPGYVTVSAHDVSKVNLVLSVHGQPLCMRELRSAWFGHQAGRYLKEHGYASIGMTTLMPAVAPNGEPDLIAPLYDTTIGLDGRQITGVAVLDTQTGAITRYTLAQAPQWISRLWPKSLVANQVTYRGEYGLGWLNSIFGQRNVQVASSVNTVEADNGQLYYYVSMTSTGADASVSGFYLVNARTKAAKYYAMPGITESSAQSAAEQVIPEKHYTATAPLPFLVAGVPTYVMALADDNGVSRDYAMVSIANNQMVAIGPTLEAAQQAYLTKLATNQVAIGNGKRLSSTQLTGIVRRIVASPAKAYLMLKGHAAIYYASADTVGPAAMLARVGDTVTVTYTESGIYPIPVSKLVDASLAQVH